MHFRDLIIYQNEIKVAMEFIEGADMNQWAIKIHQEGRYSERLIKKVFFQVCQGVHHLHAHGIVHRDIKLENILIS
jgi:serine/threonine protein kinase